MWTSNSRSCPFLQIFEVALKKHNQRQPLLRQTVSFRLFESHHRKRRQLRRRRRAERRVRVRAFAQTGAERRP